MTALVHPGLIANLYVGVAQRGDIGARRRGIHHALQFDEDLDANLLGAYQIFVDADTNIKGKAAAGVAGVVEHDTAEHQGVGDAQVIAVQRHKNGRPRGQRDHNAFIAINGDMILWRKGLPQAHENTGQIVLHGALEGEAERHPHDPGGA